MVNCCTLQMMRQNSSERSKSRTSAFAVYIFVCVSNKASMMIYKMTKKINKLRNGNSSLTLVGFLLFNFL